MRWARRRCRTEAGATLIVAVTLIAVMSIITVAVVAFTNTATKSSSAYRSVRSLRYSGDSAIQAAINWIRNNPAVGVDNAYFPGADDACRYQVDTPVGPVSTSCGADPTSSSGIPADQGKVPPEALLLLGDRHNEPGPYSWSKCSSVWDDIVRFFTNTTPGTTEKSAHFRFSQRSQGWGLLPCTNRNRTAGTVKVQGDIVAAGQIGLESGLDLGLVGSPNLRARYGCSLGAGSVITGGSCTTTIPSSTGSDGRTAGTPIDTDPARTGNNSPVDIKEEWLPVGFDANGRLKSGYSLPVRTTAYRYDPTANTSGSATVPKYLTPIAQCTNGFAGEPIIFLPGWYQDSEVLSRYTSNPACPDRTVWFAPDAGPDFTLLTDDDQTAPFYLDFTNTGGRACGDMGTAVAARWCVGGSAANAAQGNVNNSKPRIVVGWPKDWTPFGGTPSGSGTGSNPDTGARVGVRLDTAGTVDGNFLTYWTNRNNAKTINQQVATYDPCVLLWGLITCPSFGSRTLRMLDYTPKVTSGPLGDATYPNGRIFVTVAYGLQNAENLNTPELVIDALDQNGVEKSCGTYTLSKAASFYYDPASGPFPNDAGHRYTFTNAQAAQLATTCGAVANINSLRITFRATGNILNSNRPKIYLDGVQVDYDSYRGATFPLGTDGLVNSTQPAKSDCDPRQPGGQLIFGGPSHAYIADGSLEVCAGPYPGGPAEAASHQSIGIYGVPAVRTIRATSGPTLDMTSPGSNATQLVNADRARYIGEPDAGGVGGRVATIRYPGRCYGAIGIGPCDPIDGGAKSVQYSMPGYTPPTGYRIKRIEARAGYTAEGPFLGFTASSDGAKLTGGTCTEDARTTNSTIVQWANEGAANNTKLVLYDSSGARNCITPAALASGATLKWKTNVPGGWGVVFGGRCFVFIGWCDYTQEDQLDGIELDVTIEPDPSVPVATRPILRPQSGCIIAHPNYTGGENQPDCAVVRADAFTTSDTREGLCLINCSATLRGQWVGRLSVKGTIYAPSAAIEIDDNDVAYPLATRGAILRHLKISGWGVRAGFTDPAITNQIDRTPSARDVIVTACIQSEARRTAKAACDSAQGDRVLTQAGVRFLVPTGSSQADTPVVRWWSQRTVDG